MDPDPGLARPRTAEETGWTAHGEVTDGPSRRRFLRTMLAGSVVATATLAGCQRPAGDGEEPDDPLEADAVRVAVDEAYVDGETTATAWIDERLSAVDPDAEIDWVVPEAGVERYERAATGGFPIEEHWYLGVTPRDLARADAADANPFRSLDRGRHAALDRIHESLADAVADPFDRFAPVDVAYCCLVVDEAVVSAPERLQALTQPQYADAVAVPDPRSTDRGRAFLHWTVDAVGLDDVTAYWSDLLDNGAEIVGTEDVPVPVSDERPVVVGFSTDVIPGIDTPPADGADDGTTDGGASDEPTDDGVDEETADGPTPVDPPFAESAGRIIFPDGRGYAALSGVAGFAARQPPDAVAAFLDALYATETQAGIATRIGRLPVVEAAFEPDAGWEGQPAIPPEPVVMSLETTRTVETDVLETVDEVISGATDGPVDESPS